MGIGTIAVAMVVVSLHEESGSPTRGVIPKTRYLLLRRERCTSRPPIRICALLGHLGLRKSLPLYS